MHLGSCWRGLCVCTVRVSVSECLSGCMCVRACECICVLCVRLRLYMSPVYVCVAMNVGVC